MWTLAPSLTVTKGAACQHRHRRRPDPPCRHPSCLGGVREGIDALESSCAQPDLPASPGRRSSVTVSSAPAHQHPAAGMCRLHGPRPTEGHAPNLLPAPWRRRGPHSGPVSVTKRSSGTMSTTVIPRAADRDEQKVRDPQPSYAPFHGRSGGRRRHEWAGHLRPTGRGRAALCTPPATSRSRSRQCPCQDQGLRQAVEDSINGWPPRRSHRNRGMLRSYLRHRERGAVPLPVAVQDRLATATSCTRR